MILDIEPMEDLFMNILVLGNGFDLAHGLPTTYKDFLDFANVVEKISKNEASKCDSIPNGEG